MEANHLSIPTGIDFEQIDRYIQEINLRRHYVFGYRTDDIIIRRLLIKIRYIGMLGSKEK
jgi:hypothetical protein